MKQDFFIRKAKKKDIKTISKVLFDEMIKPPWNKKIELKDAIDTIKYYFKRKYLVLLCEHEGIITGFSVAEKFFFMGCWSIWVYELFVKQEFQKKGIGTALLEEIKKEFESSNIKSMELCAHLDAPSMKFYKKKGFEGEKRVLLKKELK